MKYNMYCIQYNVEHKCESTYKIESNVDTMYKGLVICAILKASTIGASMKALY
jgi:hypothetical protein